MRSIVGICVTWFCPRCLTRAKTFQIVPAGAVTPDLPQGWTVENGFTVCGGCSDTFTDSVRPAAQDTFTRDLDSLDLAEFRAA